MSPTPKEVFLRVRSLPAEERPAGLEAACGDDDGLRQEVMELLAVDAGLSRSDEGPANPVPFAGRRIGGFLIQSRIGSGGMGVVYLAQQSHPRRPVALKLLRSAVSTPQVLRRFRNEADLLARLSHPNIARVFGAGTVDVDGISVPYLAMELVAGAEPVTAFARRRSLSLRERLELFAKVCDAAHHGHQKGVIHRDLKPDNILVDADGEPKLIDFGVARMLDTSTVLTTIQTAPGQLIGTLQYMCPEQCVESAADLDIRGDVYSLGVVLYELVTDRPPLELSGDTWVSAVNRIRTEVPPPPSRIRRRLPRALDAILGKALAKSREHRYGSAAALARDLRAHLEGKPIEAHPPSSWQRLAAWIARHPVQATSALCALIAVATTSAIWLLARHYAMLPSHVTQYDTTGEVCLESRSGVRLFTWRVGTRVQDARVVQLGEDGRRALMVIYPHASPQGGHVFVYPVDPPESDPSWTTAVELEPFEREIEQNPQLVFTTTMALAADVIEAAPGNELIAVQRLRPGDWTGIRVFDAAGGLRYASYHRGAVHRAVAIPGTSRIAAAAINSANTWAELGVPCQEWPSVAFVLDVIDGHRGPTGGILTGRTVEDPTVVWYRWFGPPELVGPTTRLRLSVDPADRDRHFTLKVSVTDGSPASERMMVSHLLDADGDVLHTYPYDDYGDARLLGLPPLAECELLPIDTLPLPR